MRKKIPSLIEDDMESVCYLCGKYGNLDEHHIFEGTGRRQISDRDRLIVHLCGNCHRKIHQHPSCPENQYLYETGQLLYEEKIGTREEFIKDYIRSYL